MKKNQISLDSFLLGKSPNPKKNEKKKVIQNSEKKPEIIKTSQNKNEKKSQ